MWKSFCKIAILALLLVGCSTTTYTRHPWTEKECRQAGGLLMCEGNWGRCECVDREAAREAMSRMP